MRDAMRERMEVQIEEIVEQIDFFRIEWRSMRQCSESGHGLWKREKRALRSTLLPRRDGGCVLPPRWGDIFGMPATT